MLLAELVAEVLAVLTPDAVEGEEEQGADLALSY